MPEPFSKGCAGAAVKRGDPLGEIHNGWSLGFPPHLQFAGRNGYNSGGSSCDKRVMENKIASCAANPK